MREQTKKQSSDAPLAILIALVALIAVALLCGAGLLMPTPGKGTVQAAENRTVISNVNDQEKEISDK